MDSEGIPIKLFLVYPSNKTYFDVFLSESSKTLFLMKGVFIFKTQVSQELEMRFTLCVHSSYFISMDKKDTSLVLFLSLKIMGIEPNDCKWFW
jgi:hypothetical protein